MSTGAAPKSNFRCSFTLSHVKPSYEPASHLWIQKRYRSSQRDASSSSATLSTSRERVGKLFERTKHALDGRMYHIEILGSYRREMAHIEAVPILVTGIRDARTPISSQETYRHESQSVADVLISEGVLAPASPSEDKRDIFASSHCPGLDVTLQYVPRACQGSARLFLTGDASYIRFLRLLAIEGMGLSLNLLGLWKVPDIRRTKSTASQSKTPQDMTIEKIGSNQETEGERRMQMTRKAMGLPEGLDLSLDLEMTPSSAHHGATSNVDAPNQKEAEAALIKRADEGTYSDRIHAGSGSEAELLDLLGLVWIPPQLRSVKGL